METLLCSTCGCYARVAEVDSDLGACLAHMHVGVRYVAVPPPCTDDDLAILRALLEASL